MKPAPVPPHIAAIERPRPSLMTYYWFQALASLPAIFVVLPVLYFRFHTLRYRIDQDGIHMKWGILFRREVMLNYSRIQDIHLRSNIVERWLGLARVEIQTASGSASSTMTLEGLYDPEAMRDFLYSRMRGAQETQEPGEDATLAAVLRDVADELKRIRHHLEQRGHAG